MTYPTASESHPAFHATPLVALPVWGDAAKVGDVCGLSPVQLARLVDAGQVRHRKLGDEKQAKRLYRIADVIEFLDSPAEFPAARTAATKTLPPAATSQG